ncbi:hypothetical protein psyc5s11_20350 [Clostridium gelidum]|uniref:Uncharacterized protein n=1 Tax=Clostridium gelidum TaxID=704125 RepID=A0ABN6IYH4_9CLOT|nr:hypothetical protein psyc5s11_20350 [Clostridium gelidum]
MKNIFYDIVSNMIFIGYNVANVKGKANTWRQFPYEIKVIAENLFVPWAIDISNDGKLYFTERSGIIRIIEDGKLRSQPLITFSMPFVS